jgi:RNA polymerase sigma-32 factor
LLTQEEEFILAEKVFKQQDIKAAHALVTSHLKLVVKIAMQMNHYKMSLMDLIAEGSIGLMHAVKKFNPYLGNRLSTYATWWIKASITEYIIKSWSLVKIGTTVAQKKLFFNLNKLKRKILDAQNNNTLTEADTKNIAEQLSVSTAEVKEMDTRLGRSASLDENLSSSEDNNSTLMDSLEDKSANHELIVADNQDKKHKKQILLQALATLNKREKEIILARKLQDKAVTLDDLSKTYKISRERVRQIENKAMEKVTKFCLENHSV